LCQPSGKESLGEAAPDLPIIIAGTITPGAMVAARGPTDGDSFPASDRSHSHRHKASSINRGRPIGKREGEQFVGKPGFVNVGANSSSHLSAGGFTPTDPQRDNTQDE
jgi:hypothetical protein